MDAEQSDTCPRPGTRVVAACDLPTGSRGHTQVVRGTAGRIVHTPAYFSAAYSIRFDVHGSALTLHGITRREFRIIDDTGHEHQPGFPPADRYPQPATVAGSADPADPQA